MSFENFAEFEIRADESPAVHAFGRMDAAYKAALARMGQDAESFAKAAGEAWKALAKEQTEAIKKLSSGSAKVSIKIKLIEHSFKQASAASKSFADRFYAEVDKMIPTAEALAIALIASVGGAFKRLAEESLKFAVEFEKGLAQISTLLESEQIPQMGEIKRTILEIFQTGVTGLKDLTGALYTTISYGITDVGQALEVVRQAERGAIAGVSKVEVAAEGITVVLNSWGKEAYSVAQINDVLFQTVKRAATNFPLLAANIGKVSSIAAQAGMSLQETMAAFSTLTKAGMNTQLAMTYLKNVIAGLLKPGKASQELFRTLGIDIGQAAIQSKGLIGIMEQVAEKTGGSADAIARLFPNLRAMQGAMTLAGKGLQNFRDDLGYMQNATGAADAAYERMAKTFWAQSEMLKNTLKTVGLAFADAFSEQVYDLFKRFSAWVKENQADLFAWASTVGSALGVLVRLVTEVGAALWKLTLPVRWLINNNPWTWMARQRNERKEMEQREEELHRIQVRARALGMTLQEVQKEAYKAGVSLKDMITSLEKKRVGMIESMKGSRETQLGKARAEIEQATHLLSLLSQWRKESASGVVGGGLVGQINAAAEAMQKGLGERGISYLEEYAKKKIGTLKSQTTALLTPELTTIKTMTSAAFGHIEKAKIELNKRLKAIDSTYARDSDEWLKNRKLAHELYYKAINRGHKKALKSKDEEWVVLLSERVESAALAVIKAEEQAHKEANKRNKAGIFQAAGMVGMEGISKEATVGAKRMQDEMKASAALQAQEGHAKRDQSAFFGIVLASDAELEKKFGTQLKLVGKNVDMWRSEIMRAYSPDMISYAAAWWGAFTKTGVKGAQDFASQVQNTIMTMVNTLLGAWQNMWKGIIAGQDEAKEPLLATLLDMISSMCAQWGAFLATLAVAYAAQFNWGGMAIALIASAAMFALAGITSGAASNTRGKAQTAEREGNRAARGGGAVGGAFSGSQGSLGGGAHNVTIYMGFTFPPTKRQAEEAAVSMGRSVIPAMKNKGYKIPADTIAAGAGG